MRLPKNIISIRTFDKFNDGFSLIETVIVVTVVSIFIILILQTFISLTKGYNKMQKNSSMTRKISLFIEKVKKNSLCVDLYPRHFKDEYFFAKRELVFFSQEEVIHYQYGEKDFVITQKKYANTQINSQPLIQHYEFVKDFSISYFTQDDFLPQSEEMPYYCEMHFVFINNKELNIRMKL